MSRLYRPICALPRPLRLPLPMLLALVLTSLALPLPARAQFSTQPYVNVREFAMVLLPVGIAETGLSVLAADQSTTEPHFGAAYTGRAFGGLLVTAQAALGHSKTQAQPAGSFLHDGGWYNAGSLQVDWRPVSFGSIFLGVQGDRYTGGDGWRLSVPAGVQASFTAPFGPVMATPLVAAGLAYRHDDTGARGLAEDGPAYGWFSELGLRLGRDGWWVQGSLGWSREVDGTVSTPASDARIDRRTVTHGAVRFGIPIR